MQSHCPRRSLAQLLLLGASLLALAGCDATGGTEPTRRLTPREAQADDACRSGYVVIGGRTMCGDSLGGGGSNGH